MKMTKIYLLHCSFLLYLFFEGGGEKSSLIQKLKMAEAFGLMAWKAEKIAIKYAEIRILQISLKTCLFIDRTKQQQNPSK